MFYFSLPILFNDIRLITPSESFLILLASSFLLFFTAPFPEANAPLKTNENYLLNAWLGNLALYRVFWPFFVLLNFSLISIDLLAKAGKLTVSSWDVIHFSLILPIAWWILSVWRCSAHVDFRVWAALARLITLSVPVEYALKLLIRIDYPRLFFNCEELLTNYVNCF